MLDPTGRKVAPSLVGKGCNRKELGCAEMPRPRGWQREEAIMGETPGPFWEQGVTCWSDGFCGSSWFWGEGVFIPGFTFLELLWSPASLRAEHT